jgi:predicted MFS family arabinose efflux permease
MANDLSVSVAVAGQLVTIFAIAYAIGSPVIAVLLAMLPRHQLLFGSLAIFTLSNLLAANAPSYNVLAGARVLLALSAGAFMPAAAAYATAITTPKKRGQALAFVFSGLTSALVIGVPLGTLLASRLNWRATFIGVAIMSLVAMLGILTKLKRVSNPPSFSLSQRLAVAKHPAVLKILILTILVVSGAFLVNTYFGAFLETVFNLSTKGVAAILFAVGLAAVAGNHLGGYAADHWNRHKFLFLAITITTVTFSMISLISLYSVGTTSLLGVVVMIIFWALLGWSVPSVQQARLLSVDAHLAPIALSLNSSATYLAAAIGAALGSATIHFGGLVLIGAVAAVCELAGLVFLTITHRLSPE